MAGMSPRRTAAEIIRAEMQRRGAKGGRVRAAKLSAARRREIAIAASLAAQERRRARAEAPPDPSDD